MQNNLIICVGISGSGKSTWVGDFLKANHNYLRINRDDIRRVLNKDLVDYYNRKDIAHIEEIVTSIERNMFFCMTNSDKSIILDNTNLNKKTIEYWLLLASHKSYKVSFKLFDCDVDTSKSRVMKRDSYDSLDKVNYIHRQYKQYNEIKKWILENYKNNII